MKSPPKKVAEGEMFSKSASFWAFSYAIWAPPAPSTHNQPTSWGMSGWDMAINAPWIRHWYHILRDVLSHIVLYQNLFRYYENSKNCCVAEFCVLLSCNSVSTNPVSASNLIQQIRFLLIQNSNFFFLKYFLIEFIYVY